MRFQALVGFVSIAAAKRNNARSELEAVLPLKTGERGRPSQAMHRKEPVAGSGA